MHFLKASFVKAGLLILPLVAVLRLALSSTEHVQPMLSVFDEVELTLEEEG